MIFLRYESFSQYLRQYPITSGLLAANLLFFVVVWLTGGTTTMNLIRWGALTPLNEWWTHLASMFLHGDIIHLLFNMFALFVFAPPLERLLKGMRYLTLYIASGLIGNLATLWAYGLKNQLFVSVGASGAVYGLFGCYLYLVLFHKTAMDEQSRKTVLMILGMGAVYSILIPQVNFYAHFGGLLGGFAVFALWIRLLAPRR